MAVGQANAIGDRDKPWVSQLDVRASLMLLTRPGGLVGITAMPGIQGDLVEIEDAQL
jgi:hypothetical protein